uniref:Protein kinase domain-containing protein n=1 Tax=Oryza nivara TaxID=4536 RepID=A0A0E0GZN7_ORYNI
MGSGFDVDCTDTGNGVYKPFYGDVELLGIDIQRGMNSTEWFLNLTDTPFMLSDSNKFTVVGCRTLAYIANQDYVGKYMSGCVAGCRRAIPKGLDYYQVFFDVSSMNTSGIYNRTPCSYAVLMDSSNFTFSTTYLTSLEFNSTNDGQAPMVLDWAICSANTCEEARKKNDSYACKSTNSECFNSTNGPGYICNCSKGYEGNPYLQDIDECLDSKTYPCYGKCCNKPGDFDCTCQAGSKGNATIPGGCRKDFLPLKARLGFGTVVCVLAGLFGFLGNRVNHPNIVKLLGCCLQFEAPILVYEFVQNKTLQELMDLQRSRRFYVTLGTRLRIAAESAGALAHLHSLPHPVLHGDVKPANILLAEGLVAKVSHIGCSTIDENTQAMPKGTLGYIDPDYLLEYELTAKNDIYSFGVILVELLTGMKPLSKERKSLTSLFLEAMADGTVRELLDSDIVDEACMRVIHRAAMLASQCLVVPGMARPTMALVAEELRCLALADEVHQCPQPPFVLEGMSFMDMGSTVSIWYDESKTSGVYSLENKAVLSTEFAR